MILNFSFYLACTGIHHFIKDISTEQLLLPQNFQLTFLSAKVSQTILKRAGMFGINPKGPSEKDLPDGTHVDAFTKEEILSCYQDYVTACKWFEAAGKIDMVSMGRQFFADPAFPNKAKAGHADEIRRCLRCGRCYPGLSGEHETEIWTVKFPPLDSCTINPYDVWPASHHKVLPERMPKPEASRKVLVVGGGCGGLQTAITAADRGHQVILCEKAGVLGGLINFTDHTDHKVDIRNFKDLLIRDVEKRPIKVRLNCEVTPELIKEIAPEAVVLAVGSDDLILPIEGIENAVTAMEVYYNDFAGLGKSTIVLGGGLVGCEAAADYIDHGVETTIVEMKGALMPETTGLYRTAVHDFIDKNGGKYEVNAKVIKVGKDFVVAEQNGTEITIKADSVVNAMGRRAHATEALEAAIKEAGIPVWKIGDCVRPRQIGDAVREGWTAAMEII